MRLVRFRPATLALAALLLSPSPSRAQTVSCTGVAAWSATTTYTVGSRVTYQNGLYEALQQTTNVQPNYCPSCGWWRFLGTCGGGGNVPPSVGITAPTNNASFTAGANITLSASASDSDGSVTNVVFRRNGTAIGSPDTTSPYSVTWSNVAAGSYALTAVATDNQGATTTSATVNITVTSAGCTAAPGVPSGLNSPSQTTTSINLAWNAVAAVPNCGANQYRVFVGNTQNSQVGTTSAAVSGLQPGTSYSLSVAAVNNFGSSARTAAINVSTLIASGSCNGVPQYAAGTSYSAGQEVQNVGQRYRCNVAGWCSSSAAWAYAPGTGQHWQDAWSHLGPCGGGGNPPTVSITAPAAGSRNCQPVTISAGASDSDGSVTLVEFFVSGTKIGQDATAPYSITWTPPGNGSYALTAKATDNAANTATSAAVNVTITGCTTTGGFPRAFAPYVDVLLGDFNQFKLTANMGNVSRYYTLAFINSFGCEARWGGIIPLAQDGPLAADIASLRGAGGDIIISFGGAGGIELAQACGSEAALLAQYQAVVTRYRPKRIDLDIEGSAVAEPITRQRRHRVLAQLRANNPGLQISYTLPVLPSGLTDGVPFLQDAATIGFVPDLVNIMAMDYYQGAQDMGQAGIRAINSTVAQLQSIFPGRTAAQYRAMVGVTPMIGKNDDASLFLTSDASEILQFAQSQGLGMIAAWSANRDHQCGPNETALYQCSHISQSPFAFSQIFRAFNP